MKKALLHVMQGADIEMGKFSMLGKWLDGSGSFGRGAALISASHVKCSRYLLLFPCMHMPFKAMHMQIIIPRYWRIH